MRSRFGEPIIVSGNPPVQFASSLFEADGQTGKMPRFSLFLSRVLLFDLFSIGVLRVAEGLIFAIVFIAMLRLEYGVAARVCTALLLTEVGVVLFCVAMKKLLVGGWGANHATPFWSWRHFAYFFAQDCFFIWCRGVLAFCAGTILANPILRSMGCKVGKRTLVMQPMQCSDWNAVNFGDDCTVEGFLQFHTFENMMLKVKRAHIDRGCTVSFGATVMGGAVLEQGTTLLPLSVVLKEMNLPPGTYQGSPAESVSDTRACAGSIG